MKKTIFVFLLIMGLGLTSTSIPCFGQEEQKQEVQEFLQKIKTTSGKNMEELEKEGAFTGSYAINPANNEKIPVYTGNFVIAEYGSGMVMAVPAHDQRDFEFAKKYNIPIKVVIQPEAYNVNPEKMARAYTGEGKLANSEQFNGINNKEAIKSITQYLQKQNLGKKTVQYKLRDWLVSRQRYWGTPIPIIYCPKCGIVPVPEKDLPIKLPEDVQFGEGNPLKTSKKFINTTCPKCQTKAKRETDTMDTFVNSSWYFLRYCDPKNQEEIFSKQKTQYWMPIDLYIGGKEHACMHLIYFRFYTKFLRDIGKLEIDEPTVNLFNQGMLHGEDGAVMSKSRGNVVLPEKISKTYGIDTARLFLMFIASPDKDREWSHKGIQGSLKIINKVISLCEKKPSETTNNLAESKMHSIIQTTTQKINKLEYHRAIIDIMEYIRFLEKQENITKENQKTLLLLLTPFCPHITEELWEKTGQKPFISTANWPKANPDKIDPKAETAEQTIHQIIADIHQVKKLTNTAKPKKITLYLAQPWKYQFFNKLKEAMKQTRKMPEIIKQILTEELKPHAKTINKMIPKYLKDPSKLPEHKIDRETELEAIEHAHQRLEQEFKSPIQIIKEEETKENKAKQAMPGKPAILIE